MKFLTVIIFAAILCLLWGLGVEPKLLKIKSYQIRCAPLTGMKIAFVTDLHIAKGEKERLDKIVRAVNEQKADIVLLGGDFMKGHRPQTSMSADDLAQKLQQIETKIGMFAVLGNHDSMYGKYKVYEALQKNGIKVLENAGQRLNYKGQGFYIGGVEDLTMGNPDVQKTLQNAQGPIILLSHSPDVFAEVPDNVVLTLAGHTHGGQIYIPFLGAPISNSHFGQKYLRGHIKEGKKNLITSLGLGTSVLPIRFFCVPEIVVINFK